MMTLSSRASALTQLCKTASGSRSISLLSRASTKTSTNNTNTTNNSTTNNNMALNTTPHRHVSSSPYGRTHVWKRRDPTLPNPLPPKFPQKVIRSDGSSFTHYTTSPRSLVRLTRDTTNNPAWNTGNPADRGMAEESGSAGRMGRWARRFEDLGGELGDEGWMREMEGVGKREEVPESAKRGRVVKKK